MHTEPGQTLLAIARGAIAEQLGVPTPPIEETEWLYEPGATFVTLTCAGALRGCIGSLVAERPLRADVESNALAAAFSDLAKTRFHRRAQNRRLQVRQRRLQPLFGGSSVAGFLSSHALGPSTTSRSSSSRIAARPWIPR